jgi:hypothetical protein
VTDGQIKAKRISCRELYGTILKAADANFWTLQVCQNTNIASRVPRLASNALGYGGMILWTAVTKVKPEDIDSCLDKPAEHIFAFAAGTHGGDDFGSTVGLLRVCHGYNSCGVLSSERYFGVFD